MLKDNKTFFEFTLLFRYDYILRFINYKYKI